MYSARTPLAGCPRPSRASSSVVRAVNPTGPKIILPHTTQRPSGLLVPSALVPSPSPPMPSDGEKILYVIGKVPDDTDTMLASIDVEALDLPPLRFDEITARLAHVRFEPAISVVSAISTAVWHAGRDQALHRALARQVFGGMPILDRIERFLREDPNHVVFNEQHLAILVRLLIEHAAEGGGRDGLADDEYDLLLQAYIGITSLTDVHGAPVQDEDGESWPTWLVRNGLYFDRTNLGSGEARALAIFVDRAGAADPNGPNWCDLDAWMKTDPAAFGDQLAFATALAGFTKVLDEDVDLATRKIALQVDGLLAGQLARDTVDRLVATTSATRDELRAALAADGVTADHILWDRAAFERRPFVRTSENRLVLLGPRFLFSWMGEGFYYRLFDAAERNLDPARPHKSATMRFTRFHGELVERYVADVARAAHASQVDAGVVRVSEEVKYPGRDKTESKSPDLVLDFGTDLVVFEVTGGRPPRRARILSEPSVMRDVLDKKVIKKLTELDAATSDLLAGMVPIEGLDINLVERAWPVVVVPSSILQGDVTWSYIYDNAPGLFTSHSAMQRATLLAIDDFEELMGVVEAGNGLPEVLAARQASPYRRMPPSHFFAQRYPNRKRPALLEAALRRAASMAHAALFSPSTKG